MGFLDLFARRDINAGVTQYQADPKGVLLDVRTLLPGDGGEIAAALRAWRGDTL